MIDLDYQSNLTLGCLPDADTLKTKNLNNYLQDLFIKKIKKVELNEYITPICDGLDIIASHIENAVNDGLINTFIATKKLNDLYDPLINELKNNYDIIIVDCPPSISSSVQAMYLIADLIVIPTDPEKFSWAGVKLTLGKYNELKDEKWQITNNIKVLLNKFDGRVNMSHQTLSEMVSSNLTKGKHFQVFIRTNSDIPKSNAKFLSVFDNFKKSTSREDYFFLTLEILKEVGFWNKEIYQ